MPHNPKSVSEAVDILIYEMSEKMEITIRSMSSPDDMGSLHFGLGLYIRNNFGLNSGNSALMEDACQVPMLASPDAASSAIMAALWRRLNG
ncbi:MAG: DUF6794 domain-containing protein [Armatimonadota bacterium]